MISGLQSTFSSRSQSLVLVAILVFITKVPGQSTPPNRNPATAAQDTTTASIQTPAELLMAVAKLTSKYEIPIAIDVLQILVQSKEIENAEEIVKLISETHELKGSNPFILPKISGHLASLGRIDLSLEIVTLNNDLWFQEQILIGIVDTLDQPQNLKTLTGSFFPAEVVEASQNHLKKIDTQKIQSKKNRSPEDKLRFSANWAFILGTLGKKEQAITQAKTSFKGSSSLVESRPKKSFTAFDVGSPPQIAQRSLRILANSLDEKAATEFAKGIEDISFKAEFLKSYALRQAREGQKSKGIKTIENLVVLVQSKKHTAKSGSREFGLRKDTEFEEKPEFKETSPDFEKEGKSKDEFTIEDKFCLLVKCVQSLLEIGDREPVQKLAKSILKLKESNDWSESERIIRAEGEFAVQLANSNGCEYDDFNPIFAEPITLLANSLDPAAVQLAKGNREMAVKTLNMALENIRKQDGKNVRAIGCMVRFFAYAGEKKKAAETYKLIGAENPKFAMKPEEIELAIEEIESDWQQMTMSPKTALEEAVKAGRFKSKIDGVYQFAQLSRSEGFGFSLLEQGHLSRPKSHPLIWSKFFDDSEKESGVLAVLNKFVEANKPGKDTFIYNSGEKLADFSRMYFEIGQEEKGVETLSMTVNEVGKFFNRDKSADEIEHRVSRSQRFLLARCAIALATHDSAYASATEDNKPLKPTSKLVLKKSLTMPQIQLAERILKELAAVQNDKWQNAEFPRGLNGNWHNEKGTWIYGITKSKEIRNNNRLYQIVKTKSDGKVFKVIAKLNDRFFTFYFSQVEKNSMRAGRIMNGKNPKGVPIGFATLEEASKAEPNPLKSFNRRKPKRIPRRKN